MIKFCDEEGFKSHYYKEFREYILSSNPEKIISIGRIREIISESFGIDTWELNGKGRGYVPIFPRQLAHYYACTLTKHSLQDIARKIGRHTQHGTVLNSKKRIEQLMETKYPTKDYRKFIELEILFAPYKEKKNKEDENLLGRRL